MLDTSHNKHKSALSCASIYVHGVSIYMDPYFYSAYHLVILSTSSVCSAIWIMVRPHSGLDVHERQRELPDTELRRDEMGNYCSYNQQTLSRLHSL